MKLEYRHLNWQMLIWDTDLDTKAKVTAAYLSTHMNKDHHIAWPSLARIANKTGQSVRTVIRAVASLEKAGWLQVEHGGPNKGSNRYSPRFPNEVEAVFQAVDNSVDNSPNGGVSKSLGSVTETPDVVSQWHTNQSNRISPKNKTPISPHSGDSADKSQPKKNGTPRELQTNPRAKQRNPRAKHANPKSVDPEKIITQFRKCRFPERLSNLCRHHGLGDPPAGMDFQTAREWAIEQTEKQQREAES